MIIVILVMNKNTIIVTGHVEYCLVPVGSPCKMPHDAMTTTQAPYEVNLLLSIIKKLDPNNGRSYGLIKV